jgi:mono/diheme cytochrome c family protein
MLKYIARIFVASLFIVSTIGFAQNSGPDIYKSKCQMCHAADGSGNTPAGKSTKARAFDSPEVLKLSDDDLLKITKSGQGKMPAYAGKIPDDQLKAVIAYIHTLQKR